MTDAVPPDPKPAASTRSRRDYLAAGALLAVVVVVAVVAVVVARQGGPSSNPAGQLLPTAATVSHGADARLLSCRRGDGGTADVKVSMTNPTTIATDYRVTVAVTSPTTGTSYDAVVASYSALAASQRVSIEALGTKEVPAALACQILRVELERGA